MKDFDPAHILLKKENTHLGPYLSTISNNELQEITQIAQQKYDNKPYEAPPQSLGGDVSVPLTGRGQNNKFLPSFPNNRLSGALTGLNANRYSTNRF